MTDNLQQKEIITSRKNVSTLLRREIHTETDAAEFLGGVAEVLSTLAEKRPYSDGSGVVDFYPETLKRHWPEHAATVKRIRNLPGAERDKQILSNVDAIQQQNRYLQSVIDLCNRAASVADEYRKIDTPAGFTTLLDGLPRVLRLHIAWNRRTVGRLEAIETGTTPETKPAASGAPWPWDVLLRQSVIVPTTNGEYKKTESISYQQLHWLWRKALQPHNFTLKELAAGIGIHTNYDKKISARGAPVNNDIPGNNPHRVQAILNDLLKNEPTKH